QPYDGQRLRESHLRLSSSGVFESVSYPEVRISPDGGGVEVLIGVAEPSNNNSFSAAVGYADREGEGDRVLSGFFNLDLANIGGSLRDFAVNWRNDGKGRSETELGFKERFFFGRRMSMGIKLEQIGQDTLYTWQSVGIESAAPIGRLWGGLFGINVAVHGDRNTFSDGPQASTRRVRVIGGVNFVEGKEGRGIYVEFRTRQAYGHKWISMRDDAPDESVSQFISEIRAAGTAGVTRHVHGYIEINYKGLESPEKFVPLSEQFYVGGAATIRGYRENQFHGRRTAYARSELRLGRSAFENAYLFLDGGYVYQELRTPEGEVSNPEIFPVGYGFGLRTQSRLGNIDLSFGVGDKPSLRQTKVHVILNRSF
ncbi:MAG: BamA/TamA family outer membrane protein, partial [Candidatus Latescibacterota bacterium]